jgi:hypothetical protein
VQQQQQRQRNMRRCWSASLGGWGLSTTVTGQQQLLGISPLAVEQCYHSCVYGKSALTVAAAAAAAAAARYEEVLERLN